MEILDKEIFVITIIGQLHCINGLHLGYSTGV